MKLQGLQLGFFLSSSLSSHGRAAAELVNRSSTTNAKIGDRSMVPPNGGMIPLKRFRYGSQMVLRGPTMASGGLGNQVRTSRPISAAL